MRKAIAAAMIASAFSGCGMGPEYTTPSSCPPGYAPIQTAAAQPAATPYANPIFIPIADPQCAWEAIVDVVDDYFRIENEEPVRVAGNATTDGSITTFPEVSPTIFEPWRYDTVDPEQRVENTLQSMRRRAKIHVASAQGGYLVEVAVFKELEDVISPDHATAASATFRYDSTLTGIVNPISGEQATEDWIPRGRDTSMEQYMIAHLLSRCGQPGTPGVVMRGQDK
jgi:hypothetical protein